MRLMVFQMHPNDFLFFPPNLLYPQEQTLGFILTLFQRLFHSQKKRWERGYCLACFSPVIPRQYLSLFFISLPCDSWSWRRNRWQVEDREGMDFSSHRLSLYHYCFFFLGILLTFYPMHFLGFNVMPRRIPSFPDSFHSWNLLSSIGSGITLLSFAIFSY